MAKKTFGSTSANTEPKWFEYRQNNSGGSFITNDDVSITVLVQALSLDQAIRDAVSKAGIYFDGCSTGDDCSCCGDRWYEPWNDKGLESFTVYDWRKDTKTDYSNVEDYAEAKTKDEAWVNKGESVVILYYLDGTKTVYYKDWQE